MAGIQVDESPEFNLKQLEPLIGVTDVDPCSTVGPYAWGTVVTSAESRTLSLASGHHVSETEVFRICLFS